jgi:hypothetical protein
MKNSLHEDLTFACLVACGYCSFANCGMVLVEDGLMMLVHLASSVKYEA